MGLRGRGFKSRRPDSVSNDTVALWACGVFASSTLGAVSGAVGKELRRFHAPYDPVPSVPK